MQTTVISDRTEWLSWRAGWNALSHKNPMLSMDWLVAWWNQFGVGHQLHIVAVVEGEQLLGALPCYLHETRLGKQLRFLGSGSACSDYMGPLIDDRREDQTYAALSSYLCGFGHIESLHFEGVARSDRWLSHLETAATVANYSMRRQEMVNSWSLDVPSSWSEYLDSQRGHGVFRKAKKCVARINSQELCIRQVQETSDFDVAMQHLVRLHQARRKSVGDSGCFADPRFDLFLREAIPAMMAQGTAAFTVCERDQQVIGIQLLLLGSDTLFMYQSGVDPDYLSWEPGHAIVTGSLLFAISRGFRAYDFLRGDEPYKAFWGAKPQPLQRVILAPPTLKAQTIEAVQRNLTWLRSCYHDLSGSGAAKS